MSATLAAWLAALAIGLGLAAAPDLLGDLPNHHAEFAEADAIDVARRTESAADRFDRLARKECGQNAAYHPLLATGAVRCMDKHGRKTIVARVQP